jgi:hypothetical protein
MNSFYYDIYIYSISMSGGLVYITVLFLIIKTTMKLYIFITLS